MAKRTRYPNRTTARQAEKRAQRAADGATGATRAADRGAGDAPLPVGLPDDGLVRASYSGLTEAEVSRAEQLEAEATAKEREAIAESLRRRNRGAAVEAVRETGDVNAPLAVRAANEYAYVARDVRRIAITGGVMVLILAVLHVLVNVMEVISF